ncbi:MAG: efflux RND transporter periplasmic adaptor subunit [Candidatus Omnitrophota bacterium]|nr:efflux RND transporter periplasmic adaptor subunit [Candidatus Omnitrophota bacterium]
MKISITAVIIILLFVAASGILISGCDNSHKHAKSAQEKAIYYCPMHPTYTSDRPGDCPICNMKLVKKESVQPISDETAVKDICIEHNCTMQDCGMRVKANLKPGEKVSCPICGEYITAANGKLIEVSKGIPGVGPTVTISPEKQQLIGVKTEPVKKMNLSKIVSASGKIAYDPELVITQEEFIQALNNKDNLKGEEFKDVIARVQSLIDASRNKLKLFGMSDDEITELEKTKKAQTNLYLPAKGENVWAYISIYEYEIGLVKQGSPVEIEAVAYPGEIFEGKVVSINPVLDSAARTNQVRVEVLNTEDKLKPEMFVNAKINIDLGEKLALPESAVMDTGIRKIVYLSREGGLLESREVKLGQKAEGYYEILNGLSEGDIVVTSGNFFIDSESKLKSALEGTGHQHGQ